MSILSNKRLNDWCNNRFGEGHMFNKKLLKDFGKDIANEIKQDLEVKLQDGVDGLILRNMSNKSWQVFWDTYIGRNKVDKNK